MLFFPDTFRNPLLFLSLSPLFFITCAFPHLVTSCLSVIHPVFPHRLLYLTLYLPTPSICLASILFQFTLIYLPGCCINSAATVWEYITEEKKKKGGLENAFWICTCVCAQGLCTTASRLMRDLSQCIFTSYPSPPILCSFTSSLHLCLPFFPLRNLRSPFQ